MKIGGENKYTGYVKQQGYSELLTNIILRAIENPTTYPKLWNYIKKCADGTGGFEISQEKYDHDYSTITKEINENNPKMFFPKWNKKKIGGK